MFQSTLPRRERRQCEVHDDLQNKFQSTLPRRERQGWILRLRNIRTVSIHAPAKGATKKGISDRIENGSFNPRSREGSDIQIRIHSVDQRLFQSTLPRRERHGLDEEPHGGQGVSIHAPAKGATAAVQEINKSLIGFNPRSREGSDCIRLYFIRLANGFNPRSREGSDRSRTGDKQKPDRFQSTLPRRERRYILPDGDVDSGFNPRSREGSDLLSEIFSQ